MNATSTPPSAPPPRGEAPRRADAPRDRQRGAEFERLLREKAAAHDDDDGASTEDSVDAPADGAAQPFLTWAAPPPLKQAGGQGGAAGGSMLDAGGGSGGAARAAVQTALNAEGATPPATGPAPAAGTWEVTLRQPMSVAVDVKAVRTHEAQAGWSLTIGSPTLDASMLARHAPRLNERLQARALGDTHARIQETDAEDAR